MSTKDGDTDKYSYSGYGTGFDICSNFSLPDGSGFGKNVIILCADMSSSVYRDNKKHILILGKGLTDDTTLQKVNTLVNNKQKFA